MLAALISQNAGGYEIIGSIVFDGAAEKNQISIEIQAEAKQLGQILDQASHNVSL